jgi:hypothetical protein
LQQLPRVPEYVHLNIYLVELVSAVLGLCGVLSLALLCAWRWLRAGFDLFCVNFAVRALVPAGLSTVSLCNIMHTWPSPCLSL